MPHPLSTNSKGVHLAKVLLEHLTLEAGDGGLSAYRRYLACSERDDTSHLLLSRLPDEKLRAFFLWGSPSCPPMYFDFSLEKIALLELATETNIVLVRRMQYDTVKIHDRRIYDEGSRRRTRFFVLSTKRGKKQGKRLELDEIAEDYNRLRSEFRFIQRKSELPVGSCLVEKVGDCLAVPITVEARHEHGDWCRTTLSFAMEARRAAEEFGKGFVLVSHVGSAVPEHSALPKDQTFAVLAMAMRPGERLRRLDVVCVAGDPADPFVYKPNAEYAEWILAHERHRRPAAAGRLLDLFAAADDDVDAETARVAAAKAAVAAAEAHGRTVVTAMTEDCDYTRTVARKPVGCQCEPCLGATAFSDVMTDKGPQQPFHIVLGAEERLALLGLDSKDNLERLRTACDWSVSSFDVEAGNLSLDRRATGADSDFADVGAVSEERLRGRVLARQVPLMISWTDQRATEAGVQPWVHQYDADNREAMIAGFVEAVIARKEETVTAKRELLAPMFEAVAAMRKAHHTFFEFRPPPSASADQRPAAGSEIDCMLRQSLEEDREKHDRATEASFDHSAVGLLGKALERLAKTQLLVGFNSSSYDMPIISDMLVSYLKTRNGGKTRVFMQREGTRIKSFAFCGIKVVDARKLLADGYSLSSFAKMVGLEEHKVRRRTLLFPLSLPAAGWSWLAAAVALPREPTYAEQVKALADKREKLRREYGQCGRCRRFGPVCC